jgi:transcriptional regulator with XRE-family HTH domain
MLTIGEKIRYFRTQRGLTQAQLAEYSGLHPVSVRKYETNKMQPQLPQIERIASALGVSVGAIAGTDTASIRYETEGDLMGLLISWYKAGILCIEGKRGENNVIDVDTAQLKFTPGFRRFFYAVSETDNKKETIRMDDLSLRFMTDSAFKKLLQWEGLYHSYRLMQQKYEGNPDSTVQSALQEMADTLELTEMNLQASLLILNLPQGGLTVKANRWYLSPKSTKE